MKFSITFFKKIQEVELLHSTSKLLHSIITAGKKKNFEEVCFWKKDFLQYKECYFLELVEKDELVIFLQMVFKTNIIFSASVLILGSPSLVLEKASQMFLNYTNATKSRNAPHIEEIQDFGATIH